MKVSFSQTIKQQFVTRFNVFEMKEGEPREFHSSKYIKTN